MENSETKISIFYAAQIGVTNRDRDEFIRLPILEIHFEDIHYVTNFIAPPQYTCTLYIYMYIYMHLYICIYTCMYLCLCIG